MNWKGFTKILIPLTMLIWGIYDIVAISQGGTGSSISRVIRDWNSYAPQIAWCGFFILGHLIWPQPPKGHEIDDLKRENFKLKEQLKKLS